MSLLLWRDTYDYDYGGIVVKYKDDEGEQFLRNHILESVEKALADYLKANFDL